MNRRNVLGFLGAILGAGLTVTTTDVVLSSEYYVAESEWDKVREIFKEISEEMIYELNDEYTRKYARIEASYRARDFIVICDERNNPPELIDNNGFAMTFSKNGVSRTYTGTSIISTVSFDEIEKGIEIVV
jgi:hypothetical protein